MRNQIERTDVQEETFPLGSNGRLEVDQNVGSVQVTAWERDEAQVRAIKRARGATDEEARRHLERLDLRTHFHGQLLEVEVVVARGFLGGPGGSRIDLEIKVPRQTRVEVDSGSGAVSVEGVEGSVEIDVGAGEVALRRVGPKVRVDTGSGSVLVEDCRGPVAVDTGTGRVEVNGIDGELHVDTGLGPVTASRVHGDVEVDTGGGDVRLAGVDARRIHVDTGRGAIACDFTPGHDGRYNFDAGIGRIELTIPPDASAELELQSDTGRVECHLPLLNRDARPGRLRGVLTRADGRIICRSGSGDIIVAAGAGRPRAPRVADEDYMKVLKMVEEKRLTPEAAEELLRALEEEEDGEEAQGG